MNSVNDDLIRAFLAEEARHALATAPSLEHAVGRLAPRIEGRPGGASQRLIMLVAATLLLAAALGTAVAVGSGVLRLPVVIDAEEPSSVEPTAAPSLDTPTPDARFEAEQIIAEGTLVSFAGTDSGSLLTVWETCESQFETDCGHAWRLGTGPQPQATGMVGRGDVHVDVFASGDGFLLTPPTGQHTGTLIAQDGTASRQSMDCADGAWSIPTEPGRLAWTEGLSYVDTVTGTICPTSRLGGRPLAQGVFTADGTLWALVDNETGPDTLTIGRFDGVEWQYHDFAAQSGSWTSVIAAAGSIVVVLQANPEPSPRPDQLVGFAVTTDGGATWSEILDRDVLERDLPFSTYTDPDPDAWFSGYTSMAFAGPVLYVADGRGDLWRSTDLSTFNPVDVEGAVSDLKSAGDAVIARVAGDDLVRISADGAVEAMTAR